MDPRETVLSIMRASALNAYLLTSVNHIPRARIVAPVIDDDFTLWIITFSNSRKVEDILNNPVVTVTFNEYPSKGVREVQYFGRAELVKEQADRQRLWEAKKDSIGGYFKDTADPDYALVKIRPNFIEWSIRPQSTKEILRFT